MKQNDSFLLQEIAGIPYLLPFGQAIADHKRGLKTNAAGVYLWNLLKEEHSLEEVLSLSAAHYEIPEPEFSSFREEITQFLKQLLSFGILVESGNHTKNAHAVFSQLQTSRENDASLSGATSSPAPIERLLSIGGLTLKLVAPADAFPSEFTSFILPENHAELVHQTIILHPELPTQALHGQALLHNFELNIMEQEEQYLLHFPSFCRHLEIYLSKDAATAHCYCLPPYNETFRTDFFHAIRLLYLYLAQKHGMAALHSASLLYRDRLWLFSGHSGMGKSTHTNLWKELYSTPLINGDLNLLATENGQPVVHGIPWCGTSGIYDSNTYPLGGIILLNKAPENFTEQLSPDRKRLLVSQRLISPAWTKELWNANLSVLEPWIDRILVCKLHCTKEAEAVEAIKKEIDFFLS